MDPNKAYTEFRESIESARDIADDLLDWLRKGGLRPAGMTAQQTEELRESARILANMLAILEPREIPQ